MTNQPEQAASSVVKLTAGQVGSQLLRISFPMMIGLLAIFLANFLMLAILQPHGNLPQAVIGYFLPIMMISLGINFGFSVGVTSCVARAVGKDDFTRARLLAHRGIIMVLMINLALSLPMLLTVPLFLELLQTPPELRPFLEKIMRGWFATLIFVAPMIISNGALRGAGHNVIPGLSLVTYAALLLSSSAICSALVPEGEDISDYLYLIYVSSNTVNAFLYSFLIWRFSRFIDWARFFSDTHPLVEWLRDAKAIFSISLPAVAGQTLTSLNLLILALFFQTYGLTAITAFAVISRSEFLLLTPIIAGQVSVIAFTGQNIVNGQLDRVIQAMRVLMIGVIVYTGCIFFAFLLWPGGSALLNDDAQVVETVRHYFLIVAMSYAFESMFLFGSGIYNGCGRAVVPLVLNILRLTVLLIPFLVMGERIAGLPGLAWAVGLSNISIGLLTTVMLFHFVKQLRKGMNVAL